MVGNAEYTVDCITFMIIVNSSSDYSVHIHCYTLCDSTNTVS